MRKQTCFILIMMPLCLGLAISAFAQAAAPDAAPAVAAPAAAAPAAAAAATAAAPATPLQVNNEVKLISLIKAGGWAMWPLGACSFATISLILLNFQRVNRDKLLPPGLVAQARGAASSGDVQQLWNVANSADSFFTRALVAGLRQLRVEDPAGSRKRMEEAIAETAGREESRYAFFVNFLALLTSMSPMWGLVGTVSGMIGAFSKIGGGGMGKPEILAKNISEALVCTATGLMIAIFAMGFYFLFRNILNTVMKESEGYYSDILDSIMGQSGTFADVAPVPTEAAAAPAPVTTGTKL
jgi:biopolymer transport protein ExbB